MSESSFEMDESWIENQDAIATRLTTIEEAKRESVGAVLRYLFVSGGPKNITREQKTAAETELTPVEQFVLQWLHKRTDGKLRRHYGPGVLSAVKRALYRCERCGFADVRALNLERQRVDEASVERKNSFICICANCHTVESRAKEMAMVAAEQHALAEAKRDAAVAVEAKAKANAATEVE